jgi:hypothetical protein
MMERRPPCLGILAATVCLLAAVLLTACASASRRVTPYDETLRQIHLSSGRLAWDGLAMGMTFDRAERTVGERLPSPRTDHRRCADDHVVQVTYLTQDLLLVFSGPTGQARLKEIALRLPAGFEIGPVAAAVEARLPGMSLEPSARSLVYRANGAGRVVVDPDVGVRLGDVCLPGEG